MPEGVKKVRVRSDTAGYQHDLMRYCEGGENERFGRIEFAIGCDVTPEFKKAVREIEESEWHPLHKEVKGQQDRDEEELGGGMFCAQCDWAQQEGAGVQVPSDSGADGGAA